ncbi:Dyp-type peroxidase [Naviculisporaceae sp. PSN 640]
MHMLKTVSDVLMCVRTTSTQTRLSFLSVWATHHRPLSRIRVTVSHNKKTQTKIRRLHITPSSNMSRRVPIIPQDVSATLTSTATFLVLRLTNPGSPSSIHTILSALSSIADISKNVSVRDLNASFSCTVGIGFNAWSALLPRVAKPAELHPFREIKGNVHIAVSTPGDLLFHIRSERRDLNFEFEKQLLDRLGDAVEVVDDTEGFRYFDVRDLLGFVDGTANPVGDEVAEAVIVSQDGTSNGQGAKASAEPGGSYIVVQKYVHDMKKWSGLSTETQEAIIGRRKWDNVELDDAEEGKQAAHKTLTTIEGADGNEYAILRDNMPFGSPGRGEFGTYFIGYSSRLWVIEKMLERMFIGNPPGLHDRLLDYSRPLTGGVFFAPSASFLAGLGDN